MITVITSFSKDGYDRYAKRFMETRQKYWDQGINLVVYSEGQPAITGTNFIEIDINTVDSCMAFLARHKLEEEAFGRKRLPHMAWKTKEVSEGYSFRHDAMKFCRKPFVIEDFIRGDLLPDTTKLFWIDADTITKRPVTRAMFDEALPDGTDLCYLGREGTHSECGFMGFDVMSRAAQRLIIRLARMYESDSVFQEREWHDSFIFDIIRKGIPELKVNNLSRPPLRGSVFDRSPIGQYMQHLKGDRKDK